MSNLSFQEKSTWGSLLVTLVAAGYYFGTAFAAFAAGDADARWLISFGIGVLVLIVVAEVVFQVALNIVATEEEDERDRTIEAVATRDAYHVLSVGLVILVGHMGFQTLTDVSLGLHFDVGTAVVATVFVLVVADIVLDVSKLVRYRRG